MRADAVLVFSVLLGLIAGLTTGADVAPPEARKSLAFLKAQSVNKSVKLSWYLSTAEFTKSERSKSDPDRIVFRILRTQLDDFRWGSDYAEYFDGLTPERAQPVFVGSLKAVNRRKFEWVDAQVEPCKVYAYWVSTDAAPGVTGPASVRVVDTDVLWSSDVVASRMHALAKSHPGLVEVQSYGVTSADRPLLGLRAGQPTGGVALVGSLHAGESGPELILAVVERLLANDAGLLAKVGVAVLPVVNASQRDRMVHGLPWYLRTNGNGVDLNRNFPAKWDQVDYMYGLVTSDPDSMTYRGPEPKSESETRAVIKLIDEHRPRVVFAYHALGSITGAGVLTAGMAKGDREYSEECMRRATPFVRAFYDEPQRAAKISFGASAGSLPAWAYTTLRVPCFDLELGSQNPAEEAAKTCSMTPAMLHEYQQRHYRAIRAVLQSLTP